MSTYIVDRYGAERWLNEDDQLHRVDGPAVTWPNGTEEWRLNGKLHRVDGPAVAWSNGSGTWYLYGQRHRVDGPAVMWANNPEWYIHGRYLTLSEFNEITTWSIPKALSFPSLVHSTNHEKHIFLLLATIIRYGKRKRGRLPSPDVWTVLMEHIRTPSTIPSIRPSTTPTISPYSLTSLIDNIVYYYSWFIRYIRSYIYNE